MPDCRHSIQTNLTASDKLGHRFFLFALVGRVGEKEKVEPRPRRRSSIVLLNTFIVPTDPRDLAPLDVLRYDSCKLNTCHRYELLAVGALAGKREYDVTVIIGLPRASQTMSIPHQIHKRFPHVSTPHPHFARKQPCPNLFILYTLQNSACVGSGQNHGHFIRETLSELSTPLVPFGNIRRHDLRAPNQ